MLKDSSVINPFCFKGIVVKISQDQGKTKYIQIKSDSQKYWVKIPKRLRDSLDPISCGYQLEVVGNIKQNLKTGKYKYKAEAVAIIPQTNITATTTKPKAQILICQKSNCWKNGGKEVCQQLETILSDRQIKQDVVIKKTGCLKKCKQAPTLIMLPDKAKYSQVKPKQIEKLVEKHLISNFA
ncbi:iron-sulfur cluster-binding protein like protein [Chondrocystis sp. NIES-4102]|nr:iron-sulfur cluster-binding protein like protein [Chondrocystis sp. NIES-4102]